MNNALTGFMPHNPSEYPILPVIAVGAVVFHRQRVLLVKRRNPPMKEMWSIPGGKVHLGETLKEAAEREIKEETGITIKAGEPVFTLDLIEKDRDGRVLYHYVIIDLSAIYMTGTAIPGDDALEVKWFSKEELQLHDLPVTSDTLSLLNSQFSVPFP